MFLLTSYAYKKLIIHWWKSIDYKSLLAILCLMFIGLLLVASSGSASGKRLGAAETHFIYRQLTYISITIPIMLLISSLHPKLLRLIVLGGFMLSIILMILVLFLGEDIKGATRWINIAGISLQPSELLKPFYTIITARILSISNESCLKIEYCLYCLILHLPISILLLMQPDFGMFMIISYVVGLQIFVAGLNLRYIFLILIILIISTYIIYLCFPHVAYRINNFTAGGTLNYQVIKSINSYIEGGLLGKGLVEGVIKYQLPDSHTDFIFAVAGEEFGAIFCFFILSISLFIIIRGFVNVLNAPNRYHSLSLLGIVLYFALQFILNIAVTLHLVPTKGMILPFISYGGSALMSSSIAYGIYLNMSRKSIKGEEGLLKYNQHIKF